MALVVFLRGVNVGGHRRFRPTELVRALERHDVVNIGAAGTFVVRRPGPRARFRAALLRALPFETSVIMCDGRDVLRLEHEHPFGSAPPAPGVVRFVSVLSAAARGTTPLPVAFPSKGEWLVRVVETQRRFVFGMYRRHMKSIRYLGEVVKLLGATATTRNWNTIEAIVRVLKQPTTAVR
jgi:uncharacterized protein (DUF1697 family)